MDGYQTQSPDTSREIARLLFEHYARLEAWEKIRIIEDLNRTADEAAMVGIRERHPDATEREVKLRLAALKYGRDLMMQAFGWDPEVEGW